MKKICNKCGVEKDYEQFAKNGKSVRSYCKECEAKRARENYYKTQEYIRGLKLSCKKCEILCANCHREEHHKNLNRY